MLKIYDPIYSVSIDGGPWKRLGDPFDIRTIIPLSSLHFSPFLSTFIHPPVPLWKMWKNLWKTCYFCL